jgi:hypothetical protein
MNIKINIVEAAANIAEQQVEREYKIMYPELNAMKLYKLIWVDGIDNTANYTQEAQEIFTNIYDDLFNILIACTTPEENAEDRN